MHSNSNVHIYAIIMAVTQRAYAHNPYTSLPGYKTTYLIAYSVHNTIQNSDIAKSGFYKKKTTLSIVKLSWFAKTEIGYGSQFEQISYNKKLCQC